MIHAGVPETVPTVKFQLYIVFADLLLCRVCRADGRIARRMFVLGRGKCRFPVAYPLIIHTYRVGNGDHSLFSVNTALLLCGRDGHKFQGGLNVVPVSDLRNVEIGMSCRCRHIKLGSIALIPRKPVVIDRGDLVDRAAGKNVVLLFYLRPGMGAMFTACFLKRGHIDGQCFRIGIHVGIDLNQQLAQRFINVVRLAQPLEIGSAIGCTGAAADRSHRRIEGVPLFFLCEPIVQVQFVEVAKAKNRCAIGILQFFCRFNRRFGAEHLISAVLVLIGQGTGGDEDDQSPVLAGLFVIRCDLCQPFCQLQPGVHTGGLCVPGHHLICVDDILGVGNAHKHILIGRIRKIAVRHPRQRFAVVPFHLAPLGPSLCGVERRGMVFTGIIACIQTLVHGRIQLFPRILICNIGIRSAGIIEASITRDRHPVFAACRGRRDGIQHLLHGVKNIRPFLSI